MTIRVKRTTDKSGKVISYHVVYNGSDVKFNEDFSTLVSLFPLDVVNIERHTLNAADPGVNIYNAEYEYNIRINQSSESTKVNKVIDDVENFFNRETNSVKTYNITIEDVVTATPTPVTSGLSPRTVDPTSLPVPPPRIFSPPAAPPPKTQPLANTSVVISAVKPTQTQPTPQHSQSQPPIPISNAPPAMKNSSAKPLPTSASSTTATSASQSSTQPASPPTTTPAPTAAAASTTTSASPSTPAPAPTTSAPIPDTSALRTAVKLAIDNRKNKPNTDIPADMEVKDIQNTKGFTIETTHPQHTYLEFTEDAKITLNPPFDTESGKISYELTQQVMKHMPDQVFMIEQCPSKEALQSIMIDWDQNQNAAKLLVYDENNPALSQLVTALNKNLQADKKLKSRKEYEDEQQQKNAPSSKSHKLQ